MKILCINTRKGIGDQVLFTSYIHAISKKFKTPVSLLAKENSNTADSYRLEKGDLPENLDDVLGDEKLKFFKENLKWLQDNVLLQL